jgi:hypothetical protein
MSHVADSKTQHEFFIGWLPIPPGYRRFLSTIVVVLGVVIAALAGVIAANQKHPGTGQWEDGAVVTLRGLAFAEPYAALRTDGESPRTFLLVEDGKFGATPRVLGLLNGRRSAAVKARGTVLHREGRWMLALEPDDPGLREAADVPPIRKPDPEILADRITLRGEIVDPKCYLGAMKPGGGKTHKACAMRCIAGGIPPMLVTRDAEGRETSYLLVRADGGPANDLALPFVGDFVAATGRVEARDDLLTLVMEDNSLRQR